MSKAKTFEPLLDVENVLPILNKISIFAGFSEDQLYTLFRLIEKATYDPEEIIFEQGTQPSHIYIVKYGKVKLVAIKDDTPFELTVFEQGQCFGESSVIGIQPHAATAIAVEKTELLVLSRKLLLSIYISDIQLFSTLILNIAREICRRLHGSSEVLLHYVRKSELKHKP